MRSAARRALPAERLQIRPDCQATFEQSRQEQRRNRLHPRRSRVQRAVHARRAQRVRHRRDDADAFPLSRRFWFIHYARRRPTCLATAKLHADIARAIAKGDEPAAAKALDRLIDEIEQFTRATVINDSSSRHSGDLRHDTRTDPVHPPARADPATARRLFRRRLHPALENIVPDDWLQGGCAARPIVSSRRAAPSPGPTWCSTSSLDHYRVQRAAPAPRLEPGRPRSGVLELRGLKAVADRRHRRRPRRPGGEVPPVAAQLQVGAGRRGSEVALRHLVLAAHQLFAADRRHLHLPTTATWRRDRVGFLPGSHRWKMPSQYADENGRWIGCLAGARRTPCTSTFEKARYMAWPGRLRFTLHNCRTMPEWARPRTHPIEAGRCCSTCSPPATPSRTPRIPFHRRNT